MKTLDCLIKEREKIVERINSLTSRKKELDNNIEGLSKTEVWTEALKHGISTADELKTVIEESKKYNELILAESGGKVNV